MQASGKILMTVLIALVNVLLIVTSVRATASVFNNAIQDQPEVECGQGTIAVRVRTASQKPSYIFAKGHFHKDGCYFKQTNHATFRFEQCNVNRKREVNPRGMAYSFTVIVQLHPLFITKVDRAYNVRCFYMEENKEVDAELQVSDLTTSMLESGHAMPQCSYTLHRDSPNGPVLRYGRVGDIVFHVWDCPSDVYAMLIHSCYILDGQGGEHQVINENGCTTDDFIIPQLTYSNELTRSFAGASVVNLPDRESIYFSCQVKLCFKKGDYCTNVTPPRCDNEVHVTTDLKEKVKHIIDDDLQTDQLLYTTAGPLATSNTVRIIQTAPSDSPLPSPSTPSVNTDHVSIEVTDSSSGKSSVIIMNEIRKQNKFLLPRKQQGSKNVKFNNEIEGSGENENLSVTNDRDLSTSEAIFTSSGTSTENSETTTAATSPPPPPSSPPPPPPPPPPPTPPPPTATATATTTTTPITVTTTTTTAATTTTPTTATTTTTITTATIATASGIEIVRELNSTRDRRTVSENNYNIVDLDVATPQLKILEEGFDLPEQLAKSSLLNDRREEQGICIPVLSIWILSAFSLLSTSVAVATVIYAKLSSRKIALFYRY